MPDNLLVQADTLNFYHQQVQESLRSALIYAWKAGEILSQVRSSLLHGEWTPWLSANFQGTPQTARGYIRIFEQWDEIESALATNPNLSLRKGLKLLSSPNTDPSIDPIDVLEDIFGHAVALTQSGHLRSTIYCAGKYVYIMNQDSTILLRFLAPEPFPEPVAFYANDYDSPEFYVENGRVHFVKQIKDSAYIWTRTKTAGVPPEEIEEIIAIFNSQYHESGPCVEFTSNLLRLLDTDLHHIKMSTQSGRLVLIQYNVYNGTRMKIESDALPQIDESFEPLGLRTKDFLALFTFVDTVRFHLGSPTNKTVSVRSLDREWDMRGVLSPCIYDESGRVESVGVQ